MDQLTRKTGLVSKGLKYPGKPMRSKKGKIHCVSQCLTAPCKVGSVSTFDRKADWSSMKSNTQKIQIQTQAHLFPKSLHHPNRPFISEIAFHILFFQDLPSPVCYSEKIDSARFLLSHLVFLLTLSQAALSSRQLFRAAFCNGPWRTGGSSLVRVLPVETNYGRKGENDCFQPR